MKEIFQLPVTLPLFYKSNGSDQVLLEFNGEDVLHIIGVVDVRVVEGTIELWGFTMKADSPPITIYSSGLLGLISISSADGQKAIVVIEKSAHTSKWKTFMNEYIPSRLNYCFIF
jgi:hypothetical protein